MFHALVTAVCMILLSAPSRIFHFCGSGISIRQPEVLQLLLQLNWTGFGIRERIYWLM